MFYLYQKYRKANISFCCQKYLRAIYNAVVVFFNNWFYQNNQIYFHYYFNLINNLSYKLRCNQTIIETRNIYITFLIRHYSIPSTLFAFKEFDLTFLTVFYSNSFIEVFQCKLHWYRNFNINLINFYYFGWFLLP